MRYLGGGNTYARGGVNGKKEKKWRDSCGLLVRGGGEAEEVDWYNHVLSLGAGDYHLACPCGTLVHAGRERNHC